MLAVAFSRVHYCFPTPFSSFVSLIFLRSPLCPNSILRAPLWQHQPRATDPPTWHEALATAAAASTGRAGEDMPAAGRPESRAGRNTAGAGGKGAGSATVRPVWLALVAGRLFLREKVYIPSLVVVVVVVGEDVVVALVFFAVASRRIESVVTGRAPIILEWKTTPGKRKHKKIHLPLPQEKENTKDYTRCVFPQTRGYK